MVSIINDTRPQTGGQNSGFLPAFFTRAQRPLNFKAEQAHVVLLRACNSSGVQAVSQGPGQFSSEGLGFATVFQ